ncbi:MAG: FHA domain-containing protein [Bacteroidetes bacterium]|nr:MAG: FHA domain-containing protein [Bacteroidota bacterium]
MTNLKHIFAFWSIFLLAYLGANAQQKPQPKPPVTSPAGKESFRITEVHANKDSVIAVSVELLNKVEPMREDFKLFGEDGNPIDIQQLAKAGSEDDSKTATRLVYFLIDASNYTDGTALKNFKSAVKTALGALGEGDLANVGYFGGGEEITTINREFGLNIADLGSDIETRISANTDSTAKSDAFKAMYDAIDMLRNANKDGQRILIVVSGGVKNPASPFSTEDVVEYARKHHITIHNAVYNTNTKNFAFDTYRVISSKTDNGSAVNTKTPTDLKNALGNFLEKRATAPREVMLLYTLTFLPPVLDGAEHTFKLSYAGTEQAGKYIAPRSGGGGGIMGFLSSYYALFILIIVLLLAGLIYWQMNEMRLRRIEREEEELRQQEEIEQARLAELAKREKQQDAVIQELRSQTSKLEEQMRQKEQEMVKRTEDLKAQMQFTPTVVPASKFDMKNTIISGGGGSPVLLVSAGSFSNNYYLNKPTLTVGRAANNDIVIPEQTVSNHHATITIENGSFFLSDLGSTNGTFVNGSRVDRKLLKAGDIIKFGAANCKFEI